MLKKFNKKIEFPKLKLSSLSLPKLNISKVKTISGGIVALDIYSPRVYNFADNEITVGNINLYDRKNFYISYLYAKDIISGVIEITRGISEEDLEDAIEVSSYDELSLDSGVDYLVKYVEVFIANSENRVFNVFAIPKYKLYEIFEDTGNIKHIDLLLPSPLLFSSLYEKEYLERGKVDCFIHFDYEDAFLTIYHDGQYLFSKALTHSLKKINEEFAKLLTQHVDEKEFFNLLQTQGLKTADSVIQKNLMKIFGDLFNYINDVLQFAKRSNGIEKFDNLFITSKIGNINGLIEFASNYTNIESKKLDFTISKNSSEENIDPLAEIMIVCAKEYIGDKKESELNFSVFQKEPEFFTRPSGKLLKTVAASLLLSLAYPAYQMSEVYMFDKEYKDLAFENQNLSTQVDAMKDALGKVLAQKKVIEKKLQEKEKDLGFRTKLLHEIYNKKVNYAMKAKVLNDLFSKVNKHKSKVERLENHDREIILTVRSSKDKDITELIRDIAANEKYKVSTKLIVQDKNATYYKSAIKVGLYGSF